MTHHTDNRPAPALPDFGTFSIIISALATLAVAAAPFLAALYF